MANNVFNYSLLALSEIIVKIENSRFWDLPKMVAEALKKLQPPYKVYTALLTQSGTNAPVATVLENTLGDVVWNYSAIGKYTANLTGTFTPGKTHLNIAENILSIKYFFKIKRITSDVIEINTFDEPDLANGVLTETSIEIRVYN